MSQKLYDVKTVALIVVYTAKHGKRDEFYKKLIEMQIPQLSQSENGNIQYDYFIPDKDENNILLIEIWQNQACMDAHKQTEHFKKLGEIKQEYVENVKIDRYYPRL